MDFFGFDEEHSLEEPQNESETIDFSEFVPVPRSSNVEIFFDCRTYPVLLSAELYFGLPNSVNRRAAHILHEFRRVAPHRAIALLVGLAFMHASAEQRGCRVVFVGDLLRFAPQCSLSYEKVLKNYQLVTSQVPYPFLFFHPESAAIQIFNEAMEAPCLNEGVLTEALRLFAVFCPPKERKTGRAVQSEVVLGACVLVAARKKGIPEKKAGAVAAAIRTDKCNTLHSWVRKIDHDFVKRSPAKTRKGFEKFMVPLELVSSEEPQLGRINRPKQTRRRREPPSSESQIPASLEDLLNIQPDTQFS